MKGQGEDSDLALQWFNIKPVEGAQAAVVDLLNKLQYKAHLYLCSKALLKQTAV